MTNLLSILWLVLSQGPESAESQFKKRLGDLIQPGGSLVPLLSQPQKLGMPARLAEPWVLPEKYLGPAPRPGLEPIRPIRPTLTAEPAPLSAYRAAPVVPGQVAFPTMPLVQLPSQDVKVPPPLPFLGQRVSDRAPMVDATRESSLAAILADRPPLRTQPAPMNAERAPDPEENQQVVDLRQELPESSTPQVAPPRTLSK